MTVVDAFGRKPRKLRVSLTDRCNFRCGYCMPGSPNWTDPADNLSTEEILRLTRLFVTRAGVRSVRLTGGEPLLSPDVERIIEDLRGCPETEQLRVSLTTNGQLLGRRINGLKAAGLDDINISLDSLDPERFDELTRTQGRLPAVLAGIDAALAAGLSVKINTVLIRGRNEQDVVPLLRWARERGVVLRFIEFMPLDGGGWWRDAAVYSEADLLADVRAALGDVQGPRADGASSYYTLDDGTRFGVIPTVTRPFCGQCDRMRLTATGKLYTCLFSASGHDLKTPLREGHDDDQLFELIGAAVGAKPAGYAASGPVERPITMHSLGG